MPLSGGWRGTLDTGHGPHPLLDNRKHPADSGPMRTLICLILLTWGTTHAQTFGAGTMNPGAGRSALVVLLDYSDRSFDADLSASTYDTMLFGAGPKALVPWYAGVSAGRFKIRPGGVLGPFRMPNDAGTADDESLLNCVAWATPPCPTSRRSDSYTLTSAIQRAIEAGHDFKQYDANKDGQIHDGELALMVVGAENGQGGGFRCVDVPANNTCSTTCRTAGEGDTRVDVCLRTGTLFSSRTNIATFAHEFGHQLGALDVYGAWLPWGSSLNFRATIMSATIDNQTDWLVQFDPWHRLRFGWVKPQAVVRAGGPSACLRLTPAGAGGGPVVVFDEKRGESEYFLVEYRHRSGLDSDLAEEGVGIWHVREANGSLALDRQLISRNPPADPTNPPAGPIPSLTNRAADDTVVPAMGFIERIEWGDNGWLETLNHAADAVSLTPAIHLLGPRGDFTSGRYLPENRGLSVLWRREHGVAALTWPGVSPRTPAGVQLSVGPAEADGTYVRFYTKSPLPEGTDAACIAATHPKTATFFPPAALSFHPRCIDRATPASPVTFVARVTFPAPLDSNTRVLFSSDDAAFVAATDTVLAGQSSLEATFTANPGFTASPLTVRAEIHRDGKPPYVEPLEGAVIVLQQGDNAMSCDQLLRLGRDTPVQIPWRRRGIPVGDGRSDIPVSLLNPLRPGELIPAPPGGFFNRKRPPVPVPVPTPIILEGR